jgi:glycosyltransferase involved in cell wall biosynthesis
LVYITTSAMGARYLMTGQLAWMQDHGFEVTLLCAGGPDQEFVAAREHVTVQAIPIEREIAPLRDVRALFALIGALRRIRPVIVNFGTPKAALLGSIAATIAGVPVRVYLMRGLRTETIHGLRRWVFELFDRIVYALAHRVVFVSQSLRRLYVDELGLGAMEKSVVLAHGSSNGVDAGRYRRDPAASARLRRALGLGDDELVVGFVGRLTRDKGIEELAAAFARVVQSVPRAQLLLIGDAEVGDPVDPRTLAALRSSERVIALPHATDIAPYYGVMDVLAFPSYREGFPNVILEAACAGVPAVGFRATGTVDAIEDDVTGIVVDRGDSDALAVALQKLLGDSELRRRQGDAARRRAAALFAPEAIWEAFRTLYLEEAHKRAAERLA